MRLTVSNLIHWLLRFFWNLSFVIWDLNDLLTVGEL